LVLLQSTSMIMDQWHKRFRTILDEHQLVLPGEGVLVALSGGADSVALLHLFYAIAPRLGLRLVAAHMDHALRPESGEDAAFVNGLCQSLGVPAVCERREVAAWAAERGVGLEVAGRELRYAFLERVAAAHGCVRIALGHHREDQAETVLHRLVRGTGPAGLAAMPERRGPFVRPLLEFSRSELRDYLASRGLTYREDASNLDPAFTRNRLRHQVLPVLRSFNPRVDESLARLAATFAVEEDFWRERLASLRQRVATAEGDWSVPAWAQLHPAERRRLLLVLLQSQSPAQIEMVHVQAAERLLAGPLLQGRLELPGVRLVRRFDRFSVATADEEVPGVWCLEVPGPGRYPLPGGAELVVGVGSRGAATSPWRAEFPLEAVRYPLRLRTFCPGDRIGLEDGRGHKKLKKEFSERRLAHEVRAQLPLLVMGGEVLWVPGVRRTGKYPLSGAVGKVLVATLEKPESIESLLEMRGCLC